MYNSKNILSNPQISHYMFTQLQLIHSHFLCKCTLFSNAKRKSRRQNFNSTAPCQTVRALLRHTAYQCELNFRKDLNVVIQLIWRMHIERTFLFSD